MPLTKLRVAVADVTSDPRCMCLRWVSEVNPFDGRSSENYARTRARIVYIQKRKLFKRYSLR